MTHANPSNRLVYRPWLHAYALLLMAGVFLLLIVGGTVTSRGAGMAVPDWPNTFGHNMFAVPWKLWVNFQAPLAEQRGAFWEHSHRLIGSCVGLLTIGLCLWLWQTQRDRKWLSRLGFALLLLVIVQGLMGGFRVTENSLFLAFVHGVIGQVVFGITVLIAAATSRLWNRLANAGLRGAGQRLFPGIRAFSLCMLLLIVVQLVLGAWVRHAGAGLAIPDFPTSYGHVLPPITESSLAKARDAMPNAVERARVYSVEQVFIHFIHRAGALVVTVAAFTLVGLVIFRMSNYPEAVIPALTFLGLIALQVFLGITVVISGRNPEMATAHQSLGAAVLGVAVWLSARVHLVSLCQNPWAPVRKNEVDEPASQPAAALISGGATA